MCSIARSKAQSHAHRVLGFFGSLVAMWTCSGPLKTPNTLCPISLGVWGCEWLYV